MGRLRERERDLAAVEELLRRRGGVLLIEGRIGGPSAIPDVPHVAGIRPLALTA